MSDTTFPTRVAIAGATGKMGAEAWRTLAATDEFQVAAVLVRDASKVSHLAGMGNVSTAQSSGQALSSNTQVYTDPHQLLQETPVDIWLDFTDVRSVVQHIDLAIEHQVRPVIGATGYGAEDIARWDQSLRKIGIGGIAAPNFALGALLMIRFAKEAAQFYKNVEIIELHHDGKKDAPSGTSKRTRQTIEAELTQHQEIPIHSVRLPGLVAHQEVLFGGVGELLTIRHDSMSRASFMPGVLKACELVMKLQGMVHGLEQLLW